LVSNKFSPLEVIIEN